MENKVFHKIYLSLLQHSFFGDENIFFHAYLLKIKPHQYYCELLNIRKNDQYTDKFLKFG